MASINEQIEEVVDLILEDYRENREIDKIDLLRLPDKDVVVDMIAKLRRIILPGYSKDKNYRIYNAKHNVSMLIEDVMFHLSRQITLVLQAKMISISDRADNERLNEPIRNTACIAEWRSK